MQFIRRIESLSYLNQIAVYLYIISKSHTLRLHEIISVTLINANQSSQDIL